SSGTTGSSFGLLAHEYDSATPVITNIQNKNSFFIFLLNKLLRTHIAISFAIPCPEISDCHYNCIAPFVKREEAIFFTDIYPRITNP
ncbi:MAG: hypothetical protein AAF975_03865, partial [Spirochaetota bacterium]